jgi:hypothetical protein
MKSVSKKYVFGFVDETGLLYTPKTDRVFGLGLLKLHHPSNLHRAIINFKNSRQVRKEFKFTDVRHHNVALYKDLIDLFFQTPNENFSCLMFDKRKVDIDHFFSSDYHKAYNAFTAKLIAESLNKGEYIAVIADDVSTPKSDNYEKEVKNKVKIKARRNALFGICRVESHAVSEIQMTDVLLGTVAYAFKLKYKLIRLNQRGAKYRLVQHLQKKLGVSDLSQKFRKRLKKGCSFAIHVFQS